MREAAANLAVSGGVGCKWICELLLYTLCRC
jgi:hypothetical protein